MSFNSPEDVQSALDNGTFFKTLMADTRIVTAPGEPGKTLLSFEFPPWFNKYITKESQQLIIAKIIKETPDIAATMTADR